MKKLIIALSIFLLSINCAHAFRHGFYTVSTATSWNIAKIGGGGFFTGLDVATDGTKVVRSDVYGAWVSTPSQPIWRAMITNTSLPSSAISGGFQASTAPYAVGPYEVAISKSNSNRIYILWSGSIYVSSDKGVTFTLTNFTPINVLSSSGNGQSTLFWERLNGRRMAVDPFDPNVLYVTTPQNGAFVTFDAGNTFTPLTAIPPSISNGGTQLTTNGTTVSGNSTLHFASTTGLTTGMVVIDLTNPTAIPAGTTISSLTTTTVTMTNPANIAGVGGTDSIAFGGDFFGYSVAIDPSAVPVNGRSPNVYIAPYGSHVYQTTNGGSASPTFTVAAGSSPTTVNFMAVDAGGTVYLVDNSQSCGGPPGTGTVWIYNGTTWTDQVRCSVHSLAVHPTTAGKVVTGQDNGVLVSVLSGGVWTDLSSGTQSASDVPWLALTRNTYMSNGAFAFDPSGVNLLYFAEGIGVYSSTIPSSGAFNWSSQTAGLENMVVNTIVSSPNFANIPVVGLWDRQTFRLTDPTNYPATQLPNNNVSISMTWGIDYASSSPSTMVMMDRWAQSTPYVDFSGISTDGGASWTNFATSPYAYLLTTTASSAAGTSTLSGTVPINLIQPTGTRALEYVGTLATTTAPTSTSSNVLTFASVPANVANGMRVTGLNKPALSLNVSSHTATTVTLTGNVQVAIATGDQIAFQQTVNPLANSNPTVTSVTSTSLSVSPFTFSGSGFLAGETVKLFSGDGGAIAASSPTNIVMLGSNQEKFPWYTKDGGSTWKNALVCATYTSGACATAATGFNIDGSAIPEGGSTGWGDHYYDNRRSVVADRVTANKFYMYNSRTNAGGGGMYRSSDGGDTWAKTAAVAPIAGDDGGTLAKVLAVSGNAGHLFMTGSNWKFSNSPLAHSCDGGDTWVNLTGVTFVHTFALGVPKAGGTGYPSVIFAGKLGGTDGIYRSDDVSSTCANGTATWVNINPGISGDIYPVGWLDLISAMEADAVTYGVLYVGKSASSVVYLH